MATITRKTLDRYSGSLKQLSKKLQESAAEVFARIDFTTIDAETIQAATVALETITDAALYDVEPIARTFYDGVRYEALRQNSGIIAPAAQNRQATKEATKGIIYKYQDGGAQTIREQLVARVDWIVRSGAAEVVQNMASKEPASLKRKVRFARVPSGNETCEFCDMLASRGPVYYSAKTAGRLADHYHPDCDCVIVPVWDSFPIPNKDGKYLRRSSKTRIEGYDPDAYYERYCDKQLSKDYQKPAAANGAEIVAKREGKANADSVKSSLLASWSDGTKAWEATPEVRSWIYEDFKQSQYSWMLDEDYEALLYGFTGTHEGEIEKRRAYETAMAFTQPVWAKDEAGKWYVAETKRLTG